MFFILLVRMRVLLFLLIRTITVTAKLADANFAGNTNTDTTNSGNVTLDFATFQNHVLTLTGNVTLVNPTTEAVGQTGVIVFIQDGTGSRTVSLGTDYETAGEDWYHTINRCINHRCCSLHCRRIWKDTTRHTPTRIRIGEKQNVTKRFSQMDV